jgi:hypothetical protein
MKPESIIKREVVGWGKLAAALITIVTFLVGFCVFADHHLTGPYVEKKIEPILRTHKQLDSIEHEKLNKKIQDVKDFGGVEFRVYSRMQVAAMTETQRQKAIDDMVADTTIPRELIYDLLRRNR